MLNSPISVLQRWQLEGFGQANGVAYLACPYAHSFAIVREARVKLATTVACFSDQGIWNFCIQPVELFWLLAEP
jgi:hypothetical protein